MVSPDIFHPGRLPGDGFFVRGRTEKSIFHAGPLSVTLASHHRDLNLEHTTHVAVNLPGKEKVVDAAHTIVSFAKNHRPRP